MSQENAEKLQAFLEAWDIRGSLDAWSRGEADMSLFDPAVTYEDTILPDHVGETYRGFEGCSPGYGALDRAARRAHSRARAVRRRGRPLRICPPGRSEGTTYRYRG